MISTHCGLDEWENLSPEDYAGKKAAAERSLLEYARRVYPRLGERAVISRFATPKTYLRFTRRDRGAVGGVRQTLWNTNFFALPQDIGISNFFLVGDSTSRIGHGCMHRRKQDCRGSSVGEYGSCPVHRTQECSGVALAQDCAVLRSQAL